MYSQNLRNERLCSFNFEIALENHHERPKGRFQNRGYPTTLVDNQLKRVTKTRQTSDQTYNRGNGVPLVLTYHSRLKNFNDIIKKYLVFLYAKEHVENIFTPPPFVSFCVGFSLRKHLVRAKVYPLLRVYGSSVCNERRCQTCLNVSNAYVSQNFFTKEIYEINDKFDCDSKCINYFSLVKLIKTGCRLYC